MKTAKDEVRELLEGLPDDASLEDIQYHIYVRQKIRKGLDAKDRVSHLAALWVDGICG